MFTIEFKNALCSNYTCTYFLLQAATVACLFYITNKLRLYLLEIRICTYTKRHLEITLVFIDVTQL